MTTWKIDPAHTDINFSAKHLMVTNVRGRFDDVEGEIELDPADPTAATGEIRIDAATLSTGFEARDNHLRSADFFDVERYPQIVARVNRIEPKGSRYVVTADVTIRDVTRPIAFETEFLGVVQGMSGGRHAGFQMTAKINREEWGLNWNMALEAGGWLVGRDIKLEIEVALDEVALADRSTMEAPIAAVA